MTRDAERSRSECSSTGGGSNGGRDAVSDSVVGRRPGSTGEVNESDEKGGGGENEKRDDDASEGGECGGGG